MYRSTTLGEALQQTLDEFVRDGQIPASLVPRIMAAYDKSINHALNNRLRNKTTFKAEKLRAYRFCDNVWTFLMNSVEFRDIKSIDGPIERVKVVACDATAMVGFWGRKLTERLRLTWQMLRTAYAYQHNHFYNKKFRLGPTRQMLVAISYAAVSSSTDQFDNQQSSTSKLFARTPEPVPGSNWEKIIYENDLTVYRRWIDEGGVYEYRCAGTYRDISAEDFLRAQTDIEYRKKWDASVVKLEIVKKYDDGTEVIKWIHKFPRPMSARIYVYKRQIFLDSKSQTIRVESEALNPQEWPNDPSDTSVVRVEYYKSQLMVHAHTSYKENGFDYVLTYCDQPKAKIPGPAYKWILNYGGPYFLQEVYTAAKHLSEERKSTGTPV
ncbi:START domain-containing protein [Aphelenchoides besseyi]|nr:START domain-containing protein [Aphelenchoides besseyi]